MYYIHTYYILYYIWRGCGCYTVICKLCVFHRRPGTGRVRWALMLWWWVAFGALELRCLCPTACTMEPTSAAPKEAAATLPESPALRVRQWIEQCAEKSYYVICVKFASTKPDHEWINKLASPLLNLLWLEPWKSFTPSICTFSFNSTNVNNFDVELLEQFLYVPKNVSAACIFHFYL